MGSAIWSILREAASRGPSALADILVVLGTRTQWPRPGEEGSLNINIIIPVYYTYTYVTSYV